MHVFNRGWMCFEIFSLRKAAGCNQIRKVSVRLAWYLAGIKMHKHTNSSGHISCKNSKKHHKKKRASKSCGPSLFSKRFINPTAIELVQFCLEHMHDARLKFTAKRILNQVKKRYQLTGRWHVYIRATSSSVTHKIVEWYHFQYVLNA